MYQKWPDQIFYIVNFVFLFHNGHSGLGGGRGEGVLGVGGALLLRVSAVLIVACASLYCLPRPFWKWPLPKPFPLCTPLGTRQSTIQTVHGGKVPWGPCAYLAAISGDCNCLRHIPMNCARVQ